MSRKERAQPDNPQGQVMTALRVLDWWMLMELIVLPAQPLSPHDLSALTSPR